VEEISNSLRTILLRLVVSDFPFLLVVI